MYLRVYIHIVCFMSCSGADKIETISIEDKLKIFLSFFFLSSYLTLHSNLPGTYSSVKMIRVSVLFPSCLPLDQDEAQCCLFGMKWSFHSVWNGNIGSHTQKDILVYTSKGQYFTPKRQYWSLFILWNKVLVNKLLLIITAFAENNLLNNFANTKDWQRKTEHGNNNNCRWNSIHHS